MKTSFTHFSFKTILFFGLTTLFVFTVGFNGFATNYNGTWTSVTPSNTLINTFSNYTLVAVNPSSTGSGTSNSYVPSGKQIIITFPAGYTLNTVTGGTVNGTSIVSGFTTTATTISFNTPVAIAKSATITIILNNIRNINDNACHKLSMTIDNATGTGAGNQNIFGMSANSKYTIGTINCPCEPGNLVCGANDYITRTQFGTLDNTSGAVCTPTTGYQDFSFLVAPPTLIIGSSYNLSITVGTGTGNHSAGVWIDFNKNGSFLDPGEFFSIAQNTITPSTTTTVPILIPTTASLGNMRMRIQYAYGAAVLSSWTCFTNATWGETEDYMVNLTCGATPSDVTGRFPANGLAIPCGSAATLTWNAHTCATGFKVYMDTNPSPTTLVANSTATNYYTGNLLSNTTYYWKIVPYSGGGDGANSTWSFTTQTAINTAISQDTSGCTDNGVCMVASGGAFPDYFWYNVPVNGVPLASGTTYCPTGLTTPTTYYVSNVLQGPASSINASTTSNAVCSGPGSPGFGCFFDVKAKSANVTVTSLDLMFESNGVNPAGGTTNRPVKVYYRPTSYEGFTSSSAGWILIDNLSIPVINSPTVVTPVNITDVFVPTGQTYGIYVVYACAVKTSAGLYTNTDVEVATGAISCSSEFGSVFPDVTFHGTVYYNISCSSPTIPVIATPWVSNAQVKLALATVINAKEQCTETGWTYYANPATTNDWLFAIKKNGNTFTADVDIVESPSVYENVNAPGMHGSFLISRYWNVRVTSGSVVTPVDVRFFFDTAEVRVAYNRRNTVRTTSYPTSFDVPWRWFKSIGADFNPAVGIDGNIFTFTNFTPTSVNNYNLLGATYSGYTNNVPYVEFTGVPSFSGGTGGYGFQTWANGVLPVKLLDFYAIAENTTVKVSWITETEINNDYFTVERSKDGINYEVVDVVKSKNGNSNVMLNYGLVDKNPIKGTSYYRLKQTDYDGQYSYSNIEAVKIQSTYDDVTVYPNPVSGNGYLTFSSLKDDEQTVVIYDVAGRLVYQKQYTITTGNNKLTLETNNLTKGMYFIKLDNAEDGINFKFIKE